MVQPLRVGVQVPSSAQGTSTGTLHIVTENNKTRQLNVSLNERFNESIGLLYRYLLICRLLLLVKGLSMGDDIIWIKNINRFEEPYTDNAIFSFTISLRPATRWHSSSCSSRCPWRTRQHRQT